eukprot:SAG11_NODE_987_length_6278_cov_10.303447_2_plen_62_part_00
MFRKWVTRRRVAAWRIHRAFNLVDLGHDVVPKIGEDSNEEACALCAPIAQYGQQLTIADVD